MVVVLLVQRFSMTISFWYVEAVVGVLRAQLIVMLIAIAKRTPLL